MKNKNARGPLRANGAHGVPPIGKITGNSLKTLKGESLQI